MARLGREHASGAAVTCSGSQLGLGSLWPEASEAASAAQLLHSPLLWEGSRGISPWEEKGSLESCSALRDPPSLIVMDETQRPVCCRSVVPGLLAAPTKPPCLSHPFLTLVITKQTLWRSMCRRKPSVLWEQEAA